jgi:transposase
MSDTYDVADFVREFEWTRPRHGGQIQFAAVVFGVSVATVEKRLRRAQARGIEVEFTVGDGMHG